MLRRTGLAAAGAAATAVVAIGVPLAMAAPTAVPPSDTGGYLDSTARCTAPDTAVLFGSTKTARVAVCKTAAGGYQYRGVRVTDGAKLIAAAQQTSADTYIVDNDGVKYTLTSAALSVTANGDTFRTETWTDFHAPGAPAGSTTAKPNTSSATPSTTASTSPAPATKTNSPASPTATSSAPKTSAAPSSAVPLPPPLAAEAGGSSSAG